MAQEAGGDAGREGLFAALKNIVATLVAIGRTRAELLATELEEEKIRLLLLGSKAVGAAFLLMVGVILAICCFALLFWEQRVLVFGIFAALFIGGGLLLVRSMQAQTARPSQLFRSSLAELEADVAALRRSVKNPE